MRFPPVKRRRPAGRWRHSGGAPSARRLPPVGRCGELSFVMTRHGAILRGQIDLILRGRDGGLKVVDYKTSRIAASEVEAKAADYELQLRTTPSPSGRFSAALPTPLASTSSPRMSSGKWTFLPPPWRKRRKPSPSSLRLTAPEFSAQHPGERCRSCGYREAYCPGVSPGRRRSRRADSLSAPASLRGRRSVPCRAVTVPRCAPA